MLDHILADGVAMRAIDHNHIHTHSGRGEKDQERMKEEGERKRGGKLDP